MPKSQINPAVLHCLCVTSVGFFLHFHTLINYCDDEWLHWQLSQRFPASVDPHKALHMNVVNP